MPSISDTDARQLSKLLTDTIGRLDDAKTFQISGLENFEAVQLNLDIISRLLAVADKLEQLSSSKSYATVQSAVSWWAMAHDPSIQEFVDKVDNLIAQQSSQPKVSYKFVFLINVRPATMYLMKRGRMWKRRLNLKGHQVVMSYPRFDYYYPKLSSTAQNQLRAAMAWGANVSKLMDYSFLEIPFTARDLQFGLDKTYETATLVISLLNLASWFSKASMPIPPKRYSDILTPQAVICLDANDNFIEAYFWSKFELESKQLDPQEWDRFTKFNRWLKPVWDSPLAKVILEALIIYQLALTDDSYDFAFLKFWMGIERLTLMKPRDRQDDLLRRIQAALKSKSANFEPILSSLVKKRNQLVHEGQFGRISQKELNFMKMIFEQLLVFVVYESSKKGLNERQLKILFSLGNREDAEVKEWKDMASYELRNRK